MNESSMKRKNFSVLLTASITLGISVGALPAMADGNTQNLESELKSPQIVAESAAPQPTNDAGSTGANGNSNTTPTAGNPGKKHFGLSALPMRVCSIVAGTVVGTPVCMVRCSIWEEKYATRGMVGDTDDKFLQVAAGTAWVPLGLLTGIPEAPFSALKRSYINSDKPFSKDQFSLGHIDWK